jgi:diguanylate cyclase (GGDEF)-like protein
VSDPERPTEIPRLSGVPTRVRTEEVSVPNPATPTGPILTLSPEEISRFFVRARRGDQDTMRWDVRLDGALREILERANEFVPSESGGILLDDPRAKLAGAPAPRLTFIAAFGPGRESMLGVRVPSDRGFAGQIYRSGQPLQTDHVEVDDPIRGVAPQGSSIRTLVGVPVIVGESICGVLALSNRRSGGAYTPRDRELLRIFAAYMSSSIQNALDAIRARAQARIDDLTGLFNSRYFHTRLDDEIARADRDGTDLSVMFIDLDHFKEVNDRFGHLAGSWTLQKVAQLLQENAPAAAVLARYGGDEFVIILPGANLPRALTTGESMRNAIGEASFFEPSTEETPAAIPRVTASIGVASYRDHLAPGGTQRRRENIFLKLADSAMYRAKANGRNRVEIAEPED